MTAQARTPRKQCAGSSCQAGAYPNAAASRRQIFQPVNRTERIAREPSRIHASRGPANRVVARTVLTRDG
jgi:hypothetical protein